MATDRAARRAWSSAQPVPALSCHSARAELARLGVAQPRHPAGHPAGHPAVGALPCAASFLASPDLPRPRIPRARISPPQRVRLLPGVIHPSTSRSALSSRQHQNTLAPTDPAVAAPSSPNPSGVTLQPEDAACPSWGPSSCESRLFPARPHHARTIFALDCGSTPALLGQASTTPAALHSTHSSPLHPPPKLLRPATIIHNPACFEASLTRRTPRALLE
ncbi:hypothetical protein PtA15_8A316 [Puccinia triticina]|uniref:Uncharacterized protein n=1 Tax=Puccinia triticina TaxID=208348 RepID=A0ABY7CSF6_9BASI|nr:uncharacterized protein PtA15_8A316 [Puccinia triticina]WAQ87412.1 hypothetical protein PtA15_8A316 [Puccinia triticina]WAR57266.1 hypothetical protein PtB15_8B313 [Puccinia triticina]